jgi:hypothetical protein
VRRVIKGERDGERPGASGARVVHTIEVCGYGHGFDSLGHVEIRGFVLGSNACGLIVEIAETEEGQRTAVHGVGRQVAAHKDQGVWLHQVVIELGRAG